MQIHGCMECSGEYRECIPVRFKAQETRIHVNILKLLRGETEVQSYNGHLQIV